MISRKHLLVGIACLATAGALAAPARATPPPVNSAPPDTFVYTNPFEILVTASRLSLPLKQSPSGTTVVGGDALRTMPRGLAVDEALRLVPGVRIDNQADGERVHLSIRGQGILTERGIRGIKVLLDGLPLNDPTGLAPDLYDVDWPTVERVEVLRGPAAALYGGGGSGGVLNIDTHDGKGKPGSASLSSTIGSYAFTKNMIETGGALQNLDYRLSLARSTGDGYREHSAFTASNLYGKVHWTATPSIKITQIFGWTDYFDQNSEGLPYDVVTETPRAANPDAGAKNEYYRTRRFTDGVLANVEISKKADLQLAGYLRVSRFTMPVPDFVQHRSLSSPGTTVQCNLHMGEGTIRNHFTVGSDLTWQTIDEYTRENIGAAVEASLLSSDQIRQRGVGVFALDRVELGPQIAVMACGRYDDIHNALTDHLQSGGVDRSAREDFTKTTGRVGLSYSPIQELNLYGNVGQGFLPPTTEELSSNPDAYGGFNQHLVAATSVGEELGARGMVGKRFIYEASVFHLDTKDDFGRYRISTRPLETFYSNAGSSRRYGFETHAAYKPVQPIKVEAAYTYSDFKYTAPDSIKDNLLPNSPKHQLSVDVSYDAPHGFFLGAGSDTQAEWYVNSQNQPASFQRVIDVNGTPTVVPVAGEPATAKGFTLVNARVGWRWKLAGFDGEMSLSGRNLFDEKYMAFTEPDKDGNSYQAGPGREIFFGVRINAPR